MVTSLHFVAPRGNQNKLQSIAGRQYDLKTFFPCIMLRQNCADFLPAMQHQISPHPFDLRVLLLGLSSADCQKFVVVLKKYDLKVSLMHLETIRQSF